MFRQSDRESEANASTRRGFLKRTAQVAAMGAGAPYFFTASDLIADGTATRSKNDRPLIGAIGCGFRGAAYGSASTAGTIELASVHGDVVALCDVDSRRLRAARKKIGNGKADTYEDYLRVLDRRDVDVVMISTPDHWHAKIAIDALKAGKDVYCEKPMTLTIDEGKLICQTVKQTGRVVQVGTQQRSDFPRFLQAVAICRAGRLGRIKNVVVSVGGSRKSGPLTTTPPPKHLNWDLWLGQAPAVDYTPRRCHNEFRRWYEYAGGQVTDWGAHHVDIAQWAIGMENSGPIRVETLRVEHPVPFEDGYPTVENEFNVATKFSIACTFASGAKIIIRDRPGNGILIEGDRGRILVTRGRLVGKPVEELSTNPLAEDALRKLYPGATRQRDDALAADEGTRAHLANFFQCVRSRALPVSDVFTHHRTVSTCHLANIAARLGRSVKWDPQAEQIVDDAQANAFLKREQRQGFEIVA